MKKIQIAMLLFLTSMILIGCTMGPEWKPSGIETRIVPTAKGEIEIPVNPKRIVSDYYLGEFLALDVKPIIASPYSLSNPFLKDWVSGIQALEIASSETALERIIEANPDLIVTISEADYENLSKIAPTVYIPYGTYNEQELFLYIADLVGKQEEALSYLEAYQNDVLAVKDEIRKIVGNRKVSFAEIWPGEVYVFGSHFARGGAILFDAWELKAPERVQKDMVEGETQYEIISLEMLPAYTGDILFYGVLAGADSNFIKGSAVWNTLPAVQNSLTKEYEQVAFMHSDPITLRGQLDFYIEYFRSIQQ